MTARLTAVTCPECRTQQDIPRGTLTRCITCIVELDAMPGEYMRVVRPPARSVSAARSR